MKLLVKGNSKHQKNKTEINFPGEYGSDFITIYTNDWATNYQIKLMGRKPFLSLLIGKEPIGKKNRIV